MVEEPVLLWLALLPVGFMLGSRCSKCCNAGKCRLGSCTITINFFDENSCEDDAFDLFLENPTTGSKRFIQNVDLVADPAGSCGDPAATYANITIPVTITENDFDENCEVFVVLERTAANCCSTYTRFRIIRPDNSILLGTYFGPGGLKKKYTWTDLCESVPPEPPQACCALEEKCSGIGGVVTAGGCTAEEPECCILAGNTQQECGVPSPPGVTLCRPGFETRESPPYDCIKGGELDPLKIMIQNLKIPEITSGSRPPAWGDSLRSAVQSELNGDYVFSSICLSEVQEDFPTITFSWTEPVILPSSTGNTYTVTVSLNAYANVCNRSAQIVVGVSGPVSVGFTRTKNAITPTKEASRCPVNGVFELCRCSNFSGPWDTPADTGSVDVRKA